MKNTKCVSIMPDGSQTIFVPKKKKPRKSIERLPNGEYITVVKERALADYASPGDYTVPAVQESRRQVYGEGE